MRCIRSGRVVQHRLDETVVVGAARLRPCSRRASRGCRKSRSAAPGRRAPCGSTRPRRTRSAASAMSGTARRATAASSRSGRAKRGPSPSAKVRPRPIASGTVRMSENRIAASSAIALERLQRHLGREVRVRRQAHEAAGTGARGAVLGQVAPGLAHQPDRRVSVGCAQAGAQEDVVLERRRHRPLSQTASPRRPRRAAEHNRRDRATARLPEPSMLANDVLHTIGNTPHIRINRLFGHDAQRVRQERALEPRRLDQGPHRAVDGRGGRGRGRAQAGLDDRRADLGQHRRRPGDGRRGQGLQADPRDARQHERSSAAA